MVKGENDEVKWDVVALYKKAEEEKKKTDAASEADTPAEKPNLTLLVTA